MHKDYQNNKGTNNEFERELANILIDLDENTWKKYIGYF
ncbi:hypothetical protein PanWU01x14_030000 [Parasponia andersonii]|uniref:Uncharacterized protein n=1 Tax=Parasponia andersonii TaxID=3476 RepID=A0A2P5DUL5_PARAD|nr:hypothetical protein PanWU01x14_030000 [Parasponia andersonii]